MVSDDVEPYREAARVYFDAGWRGVLPLPPRRKASPPIGWTGRTGAWPSAADVQAWRDGDEGVGNLALRLPGDVLGIDVDNYSDKHGAATLLRAGEQYGPLPESWRSSSREDVASGIRLYRVPPGLRWPGELGPGVELILISHRYVVAWPSLHPEGRQYRWHDPAQQLVAPGVVPSPHELIELPDVWVQGITGGEVDDGSPIKAELTDLEVSSWLLTHGGGDQCSAVRSTVDGYVTERLRSGASRHDAARDATARLFRMAAEGHSGVVSAVNEIGVAFRAAFAEPAGRKYDASEWQRLYLGAIRLAALDTEPIPPKDPCSVTVLDVGTISVDDARAQAEQRALEAELATQRVRRRARELLDAEHAEREHSKWREPASSFTLADELALPDEAIAWRVESLLPRSGNALLTASYKTGKTTLANHLTRCLADELSLFGRFAITPLDGRVALWNYEVSRDQYRRWLRDAQIERADAVTVLNLRGHSLDLTVARAQDWAVAWLQERDVRVWMVDPFARAYRGDENDNRAVGDFLDALDVIKERAGITELVVITHTGRAVAEIGQERARGATRIDDWPDARWVLTKDDEGARYFAASGRDVEVEEFQLDYSDATRQLVASGKGGRKDATTDRLLNRVHAWIETNPGMSQSIVESSVTGKATAIREAIAELERRSLVRIEHDGQAKRAYPCGPSILRRGVTHDDE